MVGGGGAWLGDECSHSAWHVALSATFSSYLGKLSQALSQETVGRARAKEGKRQPALVIPRESRSSSGASRCKGRWLVPTRPTVPLLGNTAKCQLFAGSARPQGLSRGDKKNRRASWPQHPQQPKGEATQVSIDDGRQISNGGPSTGGARLSLKEGTPDTCCGPVSSVDRHQGGWASHRGTDTGQPRPQEVPRIGKFAETESSRVVAGGCGWGWKVIV